LEKGRLIDAEKAWLRSCHGGTGSRNVPASGEAVNDIGQTADIAGPPKAPGCVLGAEFCPGLTKIPIKHRFSSYIKNGPRPLR
jgi:hypothetical protein